MADSKIDIKVGVSGAEAAAASLDSIGAAAQRTGGAVAQHGKNASDGLKALDEAAGLVKEKMRGLAEEAGPVGDILQKLGPYGLLAATAIGVTTAAMVELATAAEEAEHRTLKLQAQLTATGNASGLTAKQIMDLSSQIAGSTMATQEQVQQAAQKLLAFRSVYGDTFGQVLRTAQDLSASGFGGLIESTTKLGRALEDPVNGLQAFAREGIIFSEGVKSQIEQLVKLGDTAAAQGVILDAIKNKVGGVGSADADSLTGAFHKAGEAWKGFIESTADAADVGTRMNILTTAVNEMATALKSVSGDELSRAIAELADLNKQSTSLTREARLEGTSDEAGRKKQLEDRIADLTLLGHAHEVAAAAEGVATRAEIALTAARDSGNTTGKKAKEVVEAIAAQLEEEDAKRQALIATLAVEADAKVRMLSAVIQGADAVAALNVQLAIEANLRKLGTDATEAQRVAVEGYTIAAQEAKRSSDAIAEGQKTLVKAYKVLSDQQIADDNAAAAAAQKQSEAITRYAQDAGSNVVDALIKMGEGSKKPFDNLLRYAEHTFEQMAAAAFLNPIIIPMVVSMAGNMVGAAGAYAGTAAGGANALATGGGYAGGGAALMGAGGASLAGYVDALGYNYLGIGGTVSSNGIMAGASPYLSSYAGAAGLGAGAGYLFASITGGNKTVDSIGGAAAGAALMAGQPELAAAIAIVSAVAGMFGPGPSNKTEGYQFNPATGESIQVGNAPGSAKFDQTNLNNAGNFMNVINNMVTGITKATGATYTGGKIGFDTGNRDGSNVYFYDAGGGGNFASPQDALNYATQRITTLFSGLPADVETAFKNIDWTGDLATNLSLVSFAASFQDNIRAMETGTIDIQKNAYAQASAQVQSYVAQIKQFKDTTAQLGLSTEDADRATKAFVDNLINGVPPMDQWETAIETVKGTFSAIGPLLEAVGEDAGQAATLMQKALDTIEASFNADVWARMNQAEGRGFLNDIETAVLQHNADTKDAQTVGGNLDWVNRTFTATLQNIITNGSLTVDELQVVAATFADIPEVVQLAAGQIAKLNATVAQIPAAVGPVGDWSQIVGALFDQQIQNTQDQISAAQDVADAWAKVRDNIRATNEALLIDPSLSPLSLEARRGEAWNQLQAAVTKAQGGDVEAAGQIPDLERAFLQASQDFNHSSAAYQDDFDRAQAITGSVALYAANQNTIGQMQLGVLQSILATLQAQQHAAQNVGTTPLPVPAGYTAADALALEQRYGAAKDASGLSDADFINSQAGQTVWIPARNALIAGTTDPALLKQSLADARAQEQAPGLSTIGHDYENQVIAQMNKLGITVPSYDVGGYIKRTGLAMVHKDEYVLKANDADGLKQQVAALKAAVDAQTRVLAEFGTRQLAHSATIAENTAAAAAAPVTAATMGATNNRSRFLGPKA